MNFTEKYTTQTLIDADMIGTEAKKIIISNDTYALGEVLSDLKIEIEKLRGK